MSGRAGLKVSTQEVQGFTRHTREYPWYAPAPYQSTATHNLFCSSTLAGEQTTLDCRICRVTGEELTCTLDEEIHHLNSVKINHHSSTANGRKRKKRERFAGVRVLCLCSSEQRTLPSSGLRAASTPAAQHRCGTPATPTPRSLRQAPGFNSTCLQKLDHETWAHAWKSQCSPRGWLHINCPSGARAMHDRAFHRFQWGGGGKASP